MKEALIRHPRLAAPVRLRRSARAKRLSLKIDSTNRTATLILPGRTSQAAGMAFLSAHLDWVTERLAALPEAIPFTPGQSLPLLGEPHRLLPARAAKRGVWIEEKTILVSGPEEFFARRVTDFLKREAKRQILDRAVPMAESIDRPITGIRIGDPKSRWGSCTSKGKLAFSWRLILSPETVLSYVVAHEVAHLREMNHSAEFWRWVEKLHPDIKTPRIWLKQQGAGLYAFGH